MFNTIYKSGNRRTGLSLKPSTLYKIKNVISKGLNQAVINRYIPENPAKGLVLPSLNDPIIKFFTPDELKLFSNSLISDSFGLLIAILLETGLRIGELLALELNDIDFHEKVISINKSVSYVKNKMTNKTEFIVNSPKTKNSIRRIHIMPRLEVLLRKQIGILQATEEKRDRRLISEQLLFPSENGNYLSRNTIRKRFIKLQKELDIAEVKNIHALRHTYVINALNAGVSVQNLCHIIGHSNGAITLRLYAHYIHTEAYTQLLELDKFYDRIFEINVA